MPRYGATCEIMAEVDFDKLVRAQYRALVKSATERGADKDDLALIKKAFKVAEDAHKDVRRKSGEPYITHPLAVAQIVAHEIGLGPQSIAAALMHDVIEDSEYTREDLDHLFGPNVAYIVEGLTKIQGIFDMQTSMQSENFRKLLVSISDDVRVVLIKMADRLHNMRTLDSMAHAKQLKIASETLYIFAPLAHRMGLYAFKQEFEDLSLKYLEPEVYKELDEKMMEAEELDGEYLERFSHNLEDLLRTEGFNFTMKRRTKGIYSIRRKMQNQNVPFEEVYDKYAVRIILDSAPNREKADIWRVYSLITAIYRPNPRRLRDWVTTPKANGYESLHITVMGPEGHWIEIQIRSKRMDDQAERGYAAHWRYKEDGSGSAALDAWIDRIRDVVEGHTDNAVEFVDNFKLQLFSDEIFVFTPQGKMVTLPKRATPLDFAFEIHTDLGMKTLGAKVNAQLVSLGHVLQNGDQVQIISSDTQTPQEAWLDWVVTPKAKSRLRAHFRDRLRLQEADGKDKLVRMLKRANLELNQSSTQRMLNFYGLRTPKELFVKFGKGELDSERLRDFLREDSGGFYQYILRRFRPKPKEGSIKDVSSTSNAVLFGPDEVVLEYKLAPCCRPIQGDSIFGFIEESGIEVHRTDCRHAVKLQGQFAERVIKAVWNRGTRQGFNAVLRFSGIDSKGLILKVTKVISSDMQIDIRAFHIDGSEGVFQGTVSVHVADRSHLTDLVQRLKSVKGVERVDREISTR
jgi:GTP diphosphokinase / guanosine-3',5'-bis(diphosphate) 3'-diphosphatase